MKKNITQNISLNMVLDSFDVIIFNKGGMFKIEIPFEIMKGLEFEKDDEDDEIPVNTIYEFTVQMERDHQNRFDWIKSESDKNK